MHTEKTLNFDMDGTIANFYGVEGWLDDLENFRSRPYKVAKPLVNMSALARMLNKLKDSGWKVNIISWLSKTGTAEFYAEVTEVKKKWLKKHLASVEFDNIWIVPYGTPKENFASGILFDDEQKNRENWRGQAFDVDNILGVLRGL